MVMSHTLSLVEAWLTSGECPVVRVLDMSSAQQLVTLLASYLGAKVNMLSLQSVQHLSTLVLKVCCWSCDLWIDVVNAF